MEAVVGVEAVADMEETVQLVAVEDVEEVGVEDVEEVGVEDVEAVGVEAVGVEAGEAEAVEVEAVGVEGVMGAAMPDGRRASAAGEPGVQESFGAATQLPQEGVQDDAPILPPINTINAIDAGGEQLQDEAADASMCVSDAESVD